MIYIYIFIPVVIPPGSELVNVIGEMAGILPTGK